MPKHTTFEELFKDRYTERDPDFNKQPLFEPPICMMLGGEGGRLKPSQSQLPHLQGKKEISREEAELYDRQIRLWGIEAQNRLRNSTVLLVGLSGLGAEVAKNLMLSGLKALTLMDGKEVVPDDYVSQFLLELDSVGVNRAEASKVKTQALNPMVELSVLPERVDSKPKEFFCQFDVVILIDQKYDDIVRVDSICRFYKIKFQAGGVYGWTGFAFSDFDSHTFLLPKPKQQGIVADLSSDEDDDVGRQEQPTETEGEPEAKRIRKNGVPGKKTECCNNDHKPIVTIDEDDAKVPQKVKFPSFASAMSTDFASKRMLRVSRSALLPSSYFPIRALLTTKCDAVDEKVLQTEWERVVAGAKAESIVAKPSPEELKFFLGPQLGPVCAIVGSIIGQEAIKAISQSDVPLKNFFVYSALDTTGIVSNLPLTS